MGLMYERGLGVKQSISEALFWYETAFDNGEEDLGPILDELYMSNVD